MRVRTSIVLAFAACGAPPAAVEPPVTEEVAPLPEGGAPDALVEDMRYLLREAVRDHEAGLALDAQRRWSAATEAWTRSLAEPVGARDRRLALQVEHALGRLGDVLRSGSGRAGPAWERLDGALGEVLTVLAAPTEPPPIPTVAGP